MAVHPGHPYCPRGLTLLLHPSITASCTPPVSFRLAAMFLRSCTTQQIQPLWPVTGRSFEMLTPAVSRQCLAAVGSATPNHTHTALLFTVTARECAARSGGRTLKMAATLSFISFRLIVASLSCSQPHTHAHAHSGTSRQPHRPSTLLLLQYALLIPCPLSCTTSEQN